MDFLYSAYSNETQQASLDGTVAEAHALPSDTTLLWHGFMLGASVFLAAALLELTVLDTVKNIIKNTEGGVKLYRTAWVYNVINHLGLAPLTYLVGVKLFATAEPHSLPARMIYVIAAICIHSFGYYFTHRAMHTKALWWAHRYHHRFNTFICPIAASAVTQVEYLFAYMIPFILAGAILRPAPLDTIPIAALVIGHINNLIHTPWTEDLSAKYVPWLGVSTADHFEHHRKLTNNYAAPTLNIDHLFGLSPTLEMVLSNGFGRAFGKPIGHADPIKKH